MEEKEYKFKNYRDKQAHFKRISEERGKFLFVSKYGYEYAGKNNKGRTYKKPKKIIMKEGK